MMNRKSYARYIPFVFILLLNWIFELQLGLRAGSYSWDFLGHMYQAKSSLTNLSDSIFNFKYFLGFYPILYPPLVHFVRDILIKFPHIDKYIALTCVLITSQIFFFFFLFKIFQLMRSNSWVYVIFSCIFIVSSIGYENISMREAGTIPAAFGLAVYTAFVYYFLRSGVNKKSFVTIGLLLGISLLSHTITGSVIGLILFVDFTAKVLKRNKKEAVYSIYAVFTGVLIGAVWIVPFFRINSLVPRGSITGYVDLNIVLFSAILLLMTVAVDDFKKNKQYSTIWTALVLLMFLSLFPFPLHKTGLHFRRYHYYALIVLVPFAFKGYQQLKRVKYLSICILLFFVFYISFRETKKRHLVPYPILDYMPQISGRVLDASTASGQVNFPHYFLTQIVENNKNLVATNGVFVENSPAAIEALALRMGMNRSAWFPLFSQSYKKMIYELTAENMQDKLNLFGVNYIITSRTPGPPKEDTDIEYVDFGKVQMTHRNGYIQMTLITVKDSKPLVEVLNYLPEYRDKNNDIVATWRDLNLSNLYTMDERIKDYGSLSIPDEKVNVENITVRSNFIKFYVPGDKVVPVLVKFAYSDLLSAYSDDEKIDIIRVSPDFMLVFGKGEILIRSETPFSFELAYCISVVSLVVVFILVAVGWFREKNNVGHKT